jgi:excisionase family DNA binding protein
MACLLLYALWRWRWKGVITVNEHNTESSIKLLTLREAASLLKISQRTLHRMILKGRIPAFKIGNQWRILESRFEEWVQER